MVRTQKKCRNQKGGHLRAEGKKGFLRPVTDFAVTAPRLGLPTRPHKRVNAATGCRKCPRNCPHPNPLPEGEGALPRCSQVQHMVCRPRFTEVFSGSAHGLQAALYRGVLGFSAWFADRALPRCSRVQRMVCRPRFTEVFSGSAHGLQAALYRGVLRFSTWLAGRRTSPASPNRFLLPPGEG